MSWFWLIWAVLFEMCGVLLINKYNQARSRMTLLLLGTAFGLSFALFSLAMEKLPMGTAYAIWTGFGASGGAILGMVLR